MNFGAHHPNYPQYPVGTESPYRRQDPSSSATPSAPHSYPLKPTETPTMTYIKPESPVKVTFSPGWNESYQHFPSTTNFPYQFNPAWPHNYVTNAHTSHLTTTPIMNPVSIPTTTNMTITPVQEPAALPPSPPSVKTQTHLPSQTPLALIRVPKEGAGRHLEVQFVCHANNCGRVFKRAEHLRRHIRCVHSLDRPYACPVKDCGKKFSRSDNLNQHIKTHKNYMMQQLPTTAPYHQTIPSQPPNPSYQPFNFHPPSNPTQ